MISSGNGSGSGSGSIEVISGPMFSGKSEELMRRVRRALIARLRVQIFKPAIDDRYHKENVVGHTGQMLKAQAVVNARDLFFRINDSTRLVAIDEVQFFEDEIIAVVSKLARRGLRVLLAGLDQDYRGKPFGPMPMLLAQADHVDKFQAICTVCGTLASKTYRLNKDQTKRVLVGESELYEARCRVHWDYTEEEEEEEDIFGELFAVSPSTNTNITTTNIEIENGITQ